MPKDTGRTVKLDGEAVKRLRLAKGWRVEDLAKKAKCSVKTVENVEHGEHVYLFTLTKFAEALGVECKALTEGNDDPDNDVPEPMPPPPLMEVEITLSILFNQFSECTPLLAFIESLKDLVPTRDDIRIKSVVEGSVVITVEMSEHDIMHLVDAFNYYGPKDWDIVGIKVPENIPELPPELRRAANEPPPWQKWHRARIDPELKPPEKKQFVQKPPVQTPEPDSSEKKP